MFKIKLLILLLISLFIASCIKSDMGRNSEKFSIAYIGGEYDGLILKNTITSYLRGHNAFNPNSPYVIKANISHDEDVYITNIDNTSDRTRVDSYLSLSIMNKIEKCHIYKDNYQVSQFYIIASGNKFLSNQVAVKKIKKDNTEALVKKFISNLNNISLICNDKK